MIFSELQTFRSYQLIFVPKYIFAIRLMLDILIFASKKINHSFSLSRLQNCIRNNIEMHCSTSLFLDIKFVSLHNIFSTLGGKWDRDIRSSHYVLCTFVTYQSMKHEWEIWLCNWVWKGTFLIFKRIWTAVMNSRRPNNRQLLLAVFSSIQFLKTADSQTDWLSLSSSPQLLCILENLRVSDA